MVRLGLDVNQSEDPGPSGTDVYFKLSPQQPYTTNDVEHNAGEDVS